MTSTSQLDPTTLDGLGGDYWAHARREYLSGVTAASICQRYGMSMSSFRLHARVGGWRRMDQTDCDVPPEPGEYHPDDRVGFADLADEAFLNIRRALGMGRASEAATWLRVYDKLADRARPQVMAALPDVAPPALESSRAPLRLVSVDPVDSQEISAFHENLSSGSEELDSLHPVFSESSPAADPEPGPALTPRIHPRPETCAPPPSSPGRGPHCDAESARTAR
ncbi:MAG: hypothetical protein Q8S03_14420 [Brevundimonas sp.]|uniref:hypothetical protein n=1 Tax=Brevundimonas sp. TaxID=1871086 RepID=UPI0027344457|nr:hypothetical protein [Brevundimonas sp.]MDP3405884.1 hypothetical protein [Brevundimonas sp.]